MLSTPYPEVVIQPFIHTRFDKCTGCNSCQLACSMAMTQGYNPRRARLTIVARSEHLYHLPVVCNQCDPAACMTVCPAKAISRTPEGVVAIDGARCVGCGQCITWCPVGMVFLDPDTQKSVKCELCQGDPRCVAACPTGALHWIKGAP